MCTAGGECQMAYLLLTVAFLEILILIGIGLIIWVCLVHDRDMIDIYKELDEKISKFNADIGNLDDEVQQVKAYYQSDDNK